MNIRIALLGLGIVAWVFTLSGSETVKFLRLKVDPVMAKAPQMEARSNSNLIPKGANTGNWLVVRMEYFPTYQNSKNVAGFKRTVKCPTSTTYFWIDDVDLNVRLIFGSAYKSKSGKNALGMLSGQTKFWSIKLDSDKHVAQMFVPPQILERNFPVGGNGAPQISLRSNVYIEVVFSKGGAILGQSWYNVEGKDDLAKARNFNNLLKKVSVQLNLNNAVIPRYQTPWAFYFPDSYDLEKRVE